LEKEENVLSLLRFENYEIMGLKRGQNMSKSSSLTIPSLRAIEKKDKIFVSTSFCLKQDKVVPVRAIRECGGSEGKDPDCNCELFVNSRPDHFTL
jgi:hypothetical protein